MQEIYRALARLMATDLTVMVTGESGTGKELVARALHDYGKRRKGPFVALNMAAIPRELIESELFGHERGAFTGAVQRSSGKFEQASAARCSSTRSATCRPRRRRACCACCRKGEYTTVGGRTPIKANVRIVAATHRDLASAVIQQGLFREDLVLSSSTSCRSACQPLRERLYDIPELANHLPSGGDRRRPADQGAVARGDGGG
jgi:two-component system nitrogen regulation response regulator GlnG